MCLLSSRYTISTRLCAVGGCTANCETVDYTEREESLATDYFFLEEGGEVARVKKGIIFQHVVINKCFLRNM